MPYICCGLVGIGGKCPLSCCPLSAGRVPAAPRVGLLCRMAGSVVRRFVKNTSYEYFFFNLNVSLNQ